MRNVYRQRTLRNTRHGLDVVIGLIVATAAIAEYVKRDQSPAVIQPPPVSSTKIQSKQVDLNGDGTLETIICIDDTPYLQKYDVYRTKFLEEYMGKNRDNICN